MRLSCEVNHMSNRILSEQMTQQIQTLKISMHKCVSIRFSNLLVYVRDLSSVVPVCCSSLRHNRSL